VSSDICWACLVFIVSVWALYVIGVTLLYERYARLVRKVIGESSRRSVSWFWERRRYVGAIIALALAYQLLFRYEYIGFYERGLGGFSTSGIRRVDRLTGAVCFTPCPSLLAKMSRNMKSTVVILASRISNLVAEFSIPPEARNNEGKPVYFTVLENGQETIASAPRQSVETIDGQTSAKLDYELEPGEHAPYRLVGLKILKHSDTIFDGILPGRNKETFYSAPDKDTFRIIDLAGDLEPEVLITTYSGGAHCCFTTTIYGYDSQAKKVEEITKLWGDGRPALKRLGRDASLSFVGNDTSFEFSISGSRVFGPPIRIWRYRPVRLDDVTRCYPDLVRTDANHWWTLARSQHGPYDQATGFLPGYAADMYMLGERDAALANIERSGMHGVDETYVSNLQTALNDAGYENTQPTKPNCS